ncbi:hypothetical protein FYK55_16530 [Roseiconus nitratireducens]|uniref:Uncharacterized protein n=1 Tax=Roseiconus nitratireducens TaxID=2605748 RepID=A0A5M6D9E1_9BACT|nr:hypothetical protein [Roseiconus nitratireducens]KAA5541815.1 hypothetical protein FYK55_16530 [Roseiconus nitratireducens]
MSVPTSISIKRALLAILAGVAVSGVAAAQDASNGSQDGAEAVKSGQSQRQNQQADQQTTDSQKSAERSPDSDGGYYDEPSDYSDDYYQFDDYDSDYASQKKSKSGEQYNNKPSDYTEHYYQFDDYGDDYDKTGIWHESWYKNDSNAKNDWFFTSTWYEPQGEGQFEQWLSDGKQDAESVAELKSDSQQSPSEDGMFRVSGSVAAMRSFDLVDGPKHQFIKLDLKDGGVVPVDLGRVDPLSKLNLKEGDQVTVEGKRVRINNRRMLSAQKITSGDQSVDIGRERDRDLKLLDGTVANLVSKKFRDRDNPFQVATVETADGEKETVILGPENRLSDLQLKQGGDVHLLVRQGRYNEDSVWVADAIYDGEQAVTLSKMDAKKFAARDQNESKQ